MNENLIRAANALTARGYEVVCKDTSDEAVAYILSEIPAGADVAFGGSMTLKQMGLKQLLEADGHKVLWHWDVEPADRPALLHQAMHAPYYFLSANALTTDGLIVQIDGTGNRVSAMCYGPENVYIVIGRNKLVEGGYAQALRRVKQVACPTNARRFNLDTPCVHTGQCDASACRQSICHIIMALEGPSGGKKTKIILIDEDLGY